MREDGNGLADGVEEAPMMAGPRGEMTHDFESRIGDLARKAAAAAAAAIAEAGGMFGLE